MPPATASASRSGCAVAPTLRELWTAAGQKTKKSIGFLEIPQWYRRQQTGGELPLLSEPKPGDVDFNRRKDPGDRTPADWCHRGGLIVCGFLQTDSWYLVATSTAGSTSSTTLISPGIGTQRSSSPSIRERSARPEAARIIITCRGRYSSAARCDSLPGTGCLMLRRSSGASQARGSYIAP